MKKTIPLYFLYMLLLWPGIFSAQACIINPGKGLNKIALHSSPLDTVIKQFGSAKINKEIVRECGKKGNEICWIKYSVEYKDQGIIFLSYPQFDDKKTVTDIKLKNPCACKTSHGLGLGSTKNEIITVHGEPVYQCHIDNGWRLQYDDISYILNNIEGKAIEIWIY